MNFQSILPINKADAYLDSAFSKAKKLEKAGKHKKKTSNRTDNAIRLEQNKIIIIRDTLTKDLKKITSSYPSLDSLSEFYIELLGMTIDIDKTKKALSSVKWGYEKINELSKEFQKKIYFGMNYENLLVVKKSFYGRISSILKRLDPHFKVLEESRRKLKDLPDIQENMFTVCIAGFPNVGKSTVLSKITTAKPEIKNYAFTTKGLNTGYYYFRLRKLQIVDTPGTLARYDKMNNIEKQAYLAIKYEADLVVFIFDLTEQYSLHEQKKLFDMIKKFDKPIIVYLSKTDLLNIDVINKFLEKNSSLNCITDLKFLVKEINLKLKELS